MPSARMDNLGPREKGKSRVARADSISLEEAKRILPSDLMTLEEAKRILPGDLMTRTV
ncbi:MAG: hypothetical protein K5989_12295 [Lachnospiraceae bacterium]|nr:hypothetical protein [Lachnospiraceae bacterium]